MEYIKDIILLVSESTPKDYIRYLKDNHYPYIKGGDDRVDLQNAFKELKEQFRIETILTDTGPTLNNVLLKQNLADEFSIIVAPFIVSQAHPKIFSGLEIMEQQIQLVNLNAQNLGNDHVWLRYKIIK